MNLYGCIKYYCCAYTDILVINLYLHNSSSFIKLVVATGDSIF